MYRKVTLLYPSAKLTWQCKSTYFLLGDTASNGGFSSVMLVLGGVLLILKSFFSVQRTATLTYKQFFRDIRIFRFFS